MNSYNDYEEYYYELVRKSDLTKYHLSIAEKELHNFRVINKDLSGSYYVNVRTFLEGNVEAYKYDIMILNERILHEQFTKDENSFYLDCNINNADNHYHARAFLYADHNCGNVILDKESYKYRYLLAYHSTELDVLPLYSLKFQQTYESILEEFINEH